MHLSSCAKHLVLISTIFAVSDGAATKQLFGINANNNLQCAAPLIETIFPVNVVTSFLGLEGKDPVPTGYNLCRQLFGGSCTYNLQETVISTPNNIQFRCSTTDYCPRDNSMLFGNYLNIVCEDATDSGDKCNCADVNQTPLKCMYAPLGLTFTSPIPQPYFCSCCANNNPDNDKKNEIFIDSV